MQFSYFLLPQKTRGKSLIENGSTWNNKVDATDMQEIEIQELLFDVDGILNAVWNKREDEIRQRLLELIPLEEFI